MKIAVTLIPVDVTMDIIRLKLDLHLPLPRTTFTHVSRSR
jgi:hypothetical protein